MKNKQLNNSSLRIEWDELNKKQEEEAKSWFIKAKLANRKILDLDKRKVIINFSDALKECGFIIAETALKKEQFAFRIHDDSGDRRLIWDSEDRKDVKEAEEIFKKHIEAGGRAYATDVNGEKKFRIYGFDVDLEEIIVDEKNTREKLNEFVKKVKEIKLTPKTYKG